MATSAEIATAVTTAINTSNVNSVSLKLPKFWSQDPKMWFVQVEKQFSLKNITSSSTKFDHIVANLDNDVAGKVRSAIITPAATDPYKKLKDLILARCRPSKDQRMRQALQVDALGDRKPSELLSDLERQLDDVDSGDFLKTLFLERMSSNIRMHLIASHKTDLYELAQLADDLFDINIDPPNICVVNEESKDPGSVAPAISTNELVSEISALRREVAASKKHDNTSTTTSNQEYCWYHRRFGKKATKCNEPCHFPKN